MNLTDCRTTAERYVIQTYRRHLRRKAASPFVAQGSALREELHYGAELSPDFVERFTSGLRTLDDDGRSLRLTRAGRAYVEAEAGLGSDPNEWHHWTQAGEYVRSGCGLIRSGLKNGSDAAPTTGNLCPTCEQVAQHESVSTVERTI